MIQASNEWIINEKSYDPEFERIIKDNKLDDLTGSILWNRGFHNQEEVEEFLNPNLEDLHDPFLLHDMERAVNRILYAIQQGENILIYGDYDADGMTSSSVLKTALDELGAEASVYLPNRFTDGYGPNKDVYQYYIDNEDINLIITVDNGVAGRDAIEYAQSCGVDVIVTDHHSMPDILPDAYAIVHPEHPDANYPFKHLAGVGVAFKLACALLEYVPTEMLDLVAIGTIADMVSLTGENRILVKYGLQILANTERVGLLELMKLAGVDFQDINEETVGFQIAPRLNALGRLDDPNPAVELLIGWDDELAQEIASMIDEKNNERKAIVEKITEEAQAMLDESPVQILYKEDWHPGVLGIVAGRLLEKTNKPVIMLNNDNGVLKGSARSIEAYNIFDALNPHRDLFVAFGGHAQAAGMTFKLENLPAIKEAMVNFIAENDIDMTKKGQLILDGKLDLSEIDLDLVKNLDRLAPFGMDNARPRFLVENYQVTNVRTLGQNNAHLKLRIEQGDKKVDALYFGHGAEALEFQQVESQLAVNLSINRWNGATNVQLMVCDARAEGVQLIDIRSKKAEIPSNAYIFEENIDNNDIIGSVLYLKEIPNSLDNLKNLIQTHNFSAIYFENQIKVEYYLTGPGSREQYARLYKTIYQYPEFDVRYKLPSLAQYLRIPNELLVKMVQVFAELEFVNIEDGVMTVNKEAPKREISESKIYQDLKEKIEIQEFFALAPVKEIYNRLKEEKNES
ncbi:single-stranded-DNA-specific exonuclease RecJ [Floricoccus tropicus]|uniref:Single-stranded-DNA-specific exonuclease RecJ n=1 Tax=Floricoccus tropicus TaxID=1859473 RepID=A0A1E8GQP1_9LACT|nr:single-stranded-DNA-specific exonuclease RecJ [Floricoccus tropicus]OFI50537.1 single-stranded-DNA-specific exonuclease RecJ [Floricoccus tropicus]